MEAQRARRRRRRAVRAAAKSYDTDEDIGQLVVLVADAMGVGFELALSSDVRVGERADHRYGLIGTRLVIAPGATGLTRSAAKHGIVGFHPSPRLPGTARGDRQLPPLGLD